MIQVANICPNSIVPFCVNLQNLRIILALFIVGATCVSSAAADPDQAAKDVAAVQKFLAAGFAGKTWQQGPTPMQNAALDKAFPDVRFYYVFSSQDPPKADRISVMMRVQDDGTVAQVSGPDSMNQGLMKVAGTADAKIAAAAIMSLTFGPSGPVSISSGDVPVARMNGGWYCLATPGPAGNKKEALEVIFDAGGRCISVAHRVTGRPAGH
jgi:hypothetical protein